MAVAGGVAFLLSAACVPLLVRFAVGREMLDMPNLRSSHEVPTPRLGGVAIVCGAWAGLGVGSLVYGAQALGGLWPVLAAATLVAFVGLADDLAAVPLAVRAGAQALAARVLLVAYPPPAVEALPGLAGYALLGVGVFWVVALVNAFNFMDGIDGLVAGVALVNLAFLAAIVGGSGVFAALAGASAGFLLWNVNPASIFLGDVGSYFLGFALAAGALYVPAPGAGLLGLLAGVLVFTPFLIDTSYTLLSRWRAGKDIFSAHREHVYQRITPTGAMHRRTSVLYYGASVAAGFAALAVHGGGGAALLGVLAALVLCAGVLALPKIFGEAE